MLYSGTIGLFLLTLVLCDLQRMSPRRAQAQKRVDANEERVLQAPINPLSELVANSEVCDAILLFGSSCDYSTTKGNS